VSDNVPELRKQVLPVWRRPTRRACVAMLGAAAALLAVRDRRPAKDPPRSTWTGTTRWIGHF